MARTVTQAFDEFNTLFVNLDTEQTITARASRDYLWDQLNALDTKENSTFPFKYIDMHIDFGSFARRTKIRLLDDIDLMFCLSGQGATYSKVDGVFKIYDTNDEPRFKKFCNNEDKSINSTKLLNAIKDELKNNKYGKSEIHRKNVAVTLKLSYDWTFDIVPCFFAVQNFYLIPDGNGNWQSTDPRKDRDKTTTINQYYDGKALQLIRTLKYWNRHNDCATIPSYLFEQFVLNFISSQSDIKSLTISIKDFFYYLGINIFDAVNDPKEIQDNLNNLPFEQKKNISDKTQEIYKKCMDAIEFENNNEIKKAINKWGEIFNPKFPEYEE